MHEHTMFSHVRRAAPVARDHVVEVQVIAIETFAAVLAGVLVPLENVVPGELHFLLRHMVIDDQQNHARHADAEGNRADRFRVGLLLEKSCHSLKLKVWKEPSLRLSTAWAWP